LSIPLPLPHPEPIEDPEPRPHLFPVPDPLDGWGSEDPELEAIATRRAVRPALPDPEEVAPAFALALLEIEAGYRALPQLERLCTFDLSQALLPGLPRAGLPRPHAGTLLRVRARESEPGLADVVALAQRGPRARAFGFRLDASEGRWRVSDVAW